MNRTMLTTRRLGGALGLTAFCLAAAGPPPAQAASGNIAYTCAITSFHDENDGPSDGFALSAKFDSAIEDGMKVPVGTTVRLSPVPSQLTLSAALVKAMRDLGVPDGLADVTMNSYFVQGRQSAPTTYKEGSSD